MIKERSGAMPDFSFSRLISISVHYLARVLD